MVGQHGPTDGRRVNTRVNNYELTITAAHDLTENDHADIADLLGDHLGIGTVTAEAVTVETYLPFRYSEIAHMASDLRREGYSLKAKPLTV